MSKRTLKDRLTEYAKSAYLIANTDLDQGIEELRRILTTGEGMTPQLYDQYQKLLVEEGLRSLMRAAAGNVATYVKKNNRLPPIDIPPDYESTFEHQPIQGKTRRNAAGQKRGNVIMKRLHLESYGITKADGTSIKLGEATAADMRSDMSKSKASAEGYEKRHTFVSILHETFIPDPNDDTSIRFSERADEEAVDAIWQTIYPVIKDAAEAA